MPPAEASPLILRSQQPLNAETPLSLLAESWITPQERFFGQKPLLFGVVGAVGNLLPDPGHEFMPNAVGRSGFDINISKALQVSLFGSFSGA